MEENNEISQNPYDNEMAFNELLKMMKRQEKITTTFLLDEYGYECAELESKRIVDKFALQLSRPLFAWFVTYLRTGRIDEPIPSPKEKLIKSVFYNTNDMTENGLKDFLQREIDFNLMKVVPEIIDKPNRLTVIYTYPYGCLIFRVKRGKEIMELLNSKGF